MSEAGRPRPSGRGAVTTADVLKLLCEKFPRCFVRDETQRRPLKIGIYNELRTALDGVIGARALKRALEIYVQSYRPGLRVGDARIGLDGKPAGSVLAEHVDKEKRKAKARRPPSSPPRPISAAPKSGTGPSSLADLKLAALARKKVPR